MTSQAFTLILILSMTLAAFIVIFAHKMWRHNKDRVEDDGPTLYDQAKPLAKQIKIILQMYVGIGLVGLILIKLFCRNNSCTSIVDPLITAYHLSSMHTLEIVAHALAYSAAIELAYTLFTPGPDEAIEPIIMGVAAALLLVLANITVIDLREAIAIVFYVIGLAGLFLVRAIFLERKEYLWRTKSSSQKLPTDSDY